MYVGLSGAADDDERCIGRVEEGAETAESVVAWTPSEVTAS